MSHTPAVAALLEQAHRQSPLPIQLGLERVLAVLSALGDPQQQLDVIHVAGTNGKGSVLAFLQAILRRAGYRVGLYTSPHLQSINERIEVDGCPVTDSQLEMHLTEVLAHGAGHALTFFELLTVVAFRHFVAQGLGRGGAEPRAVVLLETGLGGRLDATNVVTPLVSVVTSIAMDHTEFLGHTLRAIATEKAGIFKHAIPAVTAAAVPDVESVLRDRATRMGTPLAILGDHFTLLPSDDACFPWWFQEGGERCALPRPGLAGRHQLDNAALAVATVRRLQKAGWPVPQEAVHAGLREARWPGRLERFPLPMTGAPGAIVLDGAHNPAGCLALAHYLNEERQSLLRPTLLIFAAMQDKDVSGMVDILAPQVDRVWTTRVGGERGVPAQNLADLWLRAGKAAQACATPAEALAAACAASPPAGQLLICGSLYLVGAIRAILLANTAQAR
ncbi:MAG: bifunctional folylpolyglutamate synthase/dihydrofolate synthase [Magnetococcus sp. MYC-9]